MSSKTALKEVPDFILNPDVKDKHGKPKTYQKGKFMGRGGFARCYELIDVDTKEVFAGKIVSKTLLMKAHSREKMTQEIAIHRTLKNTHVVQFHSNFEDADNVYILLELCRRRSLMELHKRRKAVTEPEARYFLQQICLGVKHLHDQKIIHRDLKLGNLFLNDNMEVKIGDFGLATRVDFDGERKKTLCGTPNYIAPEVICKKGHSYEVDTWSTGCIMYTLLVGKPPFETTSLKDTYQRIKNNEYSLPGRLSSHAQTLLRRLLADDPRSRPSMAQILEDPFFSLGFLPPRLPTTCLSMAPRFDKVDTSFRAPSQGLAVHSPNVPLSSQPSTRRVLAEKNNIGEQDAVAAASVKGAAAAATARAGIRDKMAVGGARGEGRAFDTETEGHLEQLALQLAAALRSSGKHGEGVEENIREAKLAEDDCEAPEAVPIFWVAKWVDYSDKYGLGYSLSDNSCGVLFNDQTRLLLLADGENIEYIERNGAEQFHTLHQHPDTLTKKVTLLKYFKNYMIEHLLQAGASMQPRVEDNMSRLPFLRSWFRTKSAIILHLSNGTLQINFFQDHSKIILEPTMSSVSYIDDQRHCRVFRLASTPDSKETSISGSGCTSSLMQRLKYAKTMVERLQDTKSSTASAGGAAGGVGVAGSVGVKAS